VYQLVNGAAGTKRFRFGNHPVRLQKLEREVPRVRTVALFTSRAPAEELAGLLNRDRT
jgi:hypothetical protein